MKLLQWTLFLFYSADPSRGLGAEARFYDLSGGECRGREPHNRSQYMGRGERPKPLEARRFARLATIRLRQRSTAGRARWRQRDSRQQERHVYYISPTCR